MRLQFNSLHFRIRYLNLGRIFSLIELGFYTKTIARRCFPNQLYNHLMANQRPPSPIHADVREQPMFYFIPLAGPRGKMTRGNPQTGLRCQRQPSQRPIHTRLDPLSPQSRISKAMLRALLSSSIFCGESDPIKFVRTDLCRLTSSSQ